MIQEYHRPTTVEQALELLSRPQPMTLPLGGGTVISHHHPDGCAVVDLQLLALNKMVRQDNLLKIGATVTLQQLLGGADLPAALAGVLEQEKNPNQRRMATLAGSLVTASGRSPLATALLALNACLVWQPGNREINVKEFFANRGGNQPGKLISEVVVPVDARLAVDWVGRSPKDQPMLIVAAAHLASGSYRVALGGFGAAPCLALDATSINGVEKAVSEALAGSDDAWATAEYRTQAALALVKRLLAAVA